MFFEPDILHSYAGGARFPDPVDGSLWGPPLDFWKANAHRILAWHVKDGSRLVPPPARREPVHPDARAGAEVHGRDPPGEGSIGQGYPVDPDPAVVGYKRIFDEVAEKGSRYYDHRATAAPARRATPAARCATPSTACRTCWACAAA